MIRRIHITGAPRSGTTLVHELFRTCFDIGGSCDHEMSIFDEPPADAAWPYVSKQPRDELVVKPILEADEQLAVLWVVRDPRAVVTSIHRKAPGMYFTNLLTWLRCDDAAAAMAGHPRFLAVRYDTLVASADAEQSRIAERWPFIKARRPFSEFDKHAVASKGAQAALGGVRPISTERLASWREHLPRVKAEFERHPAAFDRLVAHGYEPDRSWATILDAVVADPGRCRVPERVYLLKEFDRRRRNWFKTRRAVARARRRSTQGGGEA